MLFQTTQPFQTLRRTRGQFTPKQKIKQRGFCGIKKSVSSEKKMELFLLKDNCISFQMNQTFQKFGGPLLDDRQLFHIQLWFWLLSFSSKENNFLVTANVVV